MKERVIDEPSEDKKELVSTYRDNPFLSEDYIKTILALKQQDANFWRIFGLGEWGVLENLVYGIWTEVDALPEGGETIYGLDFGFNQPSALVEIRLKDEEVYLKQLIYETGLTNSALIARMQTLIPDKSKEVYCDSAEPARIEEIYGAGFNAHPSDKSVKDGIDYVKRQKISVTRDSPDIIKERRSYSYKKDKTGRILDEPIKFADHSLDGIRYALYTNSLKFEPKIRWL
jgi:phage terminase large subunit